MIYLLAFVLLAISFLLSPLTISYAERFSIVDIANHRSSHTGITPRGGAVIIILIFYIGFILLSFIQNIPCSVYGIVLFGAIPALIGWLDDYKHLSVRLRFATQFFVVLLSSFFIPRIWLFIPLLLEKTILILAWVWFINLFNFMDGTDGFAAQEAIYICIGIFLFSSRMNYIALILAAPILGFLRVNYPKAKIFMGDVGSLFLGYILGGMLIYSIDASYRINYIQPIILTSLFGFDATFTIMKRVFRGEKIWTAHRKHWYQRLNIAGASHKNIFWLGTIYNFFVLLIIFMNRVGCLTIYIEIICCIGLFSLYCFYIRKREEKLGIDN